MSETESIDMAGLDREIGFALRLAQLAVFKDLIACLKPYALRPAEYSVLVVVNSNPGLRQLALGAILSVQGPNLVTMVDQLEARNLILRRQVPEDRRAHALHLTAKGRSLLRQAKTAHAGHQTRLSRCLGQTSALDLIAILNRIAAAETWTSGKSVNPSRT
jgi:DNA-binding MarR family transcriptional regulator